MTNEQRNNGKDQDRVWPQAVNWDLGLGSASYSDVRWRCDALRAGKLYQRSLFGSQAEAEEFARKMRDAEPDQMFSVEQIMARTVWN
jgi:hypothetical protein